MLFPLCIRCLRHVPLLGGSALLRLDVVFLFVHLVPLLSSFDCIVCFFGVWVLFSFCVHLVLLLYSFCLRVLYFPVFGYCPSFLVHSVRSLFGAAVCLVVFAASSVPLSAGFGAVTFEGGFPFFLLYYRGLVSSLGVWPLSHSCFFVVLFIYCFIMRFVVLFPCLVLFRPTEHWSSPVVALCGAVWFP